MPKKCYKCDKCKEEVKEGDNFCSNCGQELVWDDENDVNSTDHDSESTDNKYDGVGFYLLGKKELPPDIEGFNNHIATTVKKKHISNSIDENNLELQRSTLYLQHYLYDIGKKEGDDISDMLDKTLFGIDKIYKEMLASGIEQWNSEATAEERINTILRTMAGNPELFAPDSVAFGVALGELAALYNIKEGNLYWKWDLNNHECHAVLNKKFVDVALKNKCGLSLPTTFPDVIDLTRVAS